ncbi:MAG: hypothetical protein K0S32_3727, partial [Bacteroidetes bacterium]|nr:hypothetical protein [Bacteroidota bacterium]
PTGTYYYILELGDDKLTPEENLRRGFIQIQY